ncbi:MAG: hypothetical protein ABEJ58_07510 [Halodesulfurarchaeum sp.]
MTDDDQPDEESSGEDEEKSFRERVEEIREERSEQAESEGQDDEQSRRERMEEMMGGGGGPGGMGGGGPGGMGGGNPFAQMMSGMMGGGGPGGMGGAQGQEEEGNIRLAREIEALRNQVEDATEQLERIADALEDD